MDLSALAQMAVPLLSKLGITSPAVQQLLTKLPQALEVAKKYQNSPEGIKQALQEFNLSGAELQKLVGYSQDPKLRMALQMLKPEALPIMDSLAERFRNSAKPKQPSGFVYPPVHRRK